MEPSEDCTTPQNSRTKFSSPIDQSKTPVRTPDSKPIFLTPCRPMGLRRRPLKNATSPVCSSSGSTEKSPQTKSVTMLLPNKCDSNGNAHSLHESIITDVGKSAQTLKKHKLDSPSDLNTQCRPIKMKRMNLFTTKRESNHNPGEATPQLEVLRQRVKEKEETLKRLKLVQLYKKKHDLKKLVALTLKWRLICQAGLEKILDVLTSRGQTISMVQLLEQLHIPAQVACYNSEAEEFEIPNADNS
ncbi:hypothetical protein C0J52_03292 [Blattella germanica]|nr:hypothetical protein C0J52_03292 [Blattella germanica]